MTKARLTPAQANLLARIERHDALRPGRTFSGPHMPDRLRPALRLAIGTDERYRFPTQMGSKNTLDRLHAKGYLTLVVADRTCPVYVLTSSAVPKLVHTYFGPDAHVVIAQVFKGGWKEHAGPFPPATIAQLQTLKRDGYTHVGLMSHRPYQVADFVIDEILRGEQS